MATLAGIWERFLAGRDVQARATPDDYFVRPLPKEDIHFYVKRFDNTKVARLVDHGDRRTSFGLASTAPLVALLFIAMLLPGGYNLLASRRMESLQRDREALLNQMKELKAEYAAVVSPTNLDVWAAGSYEAPKASALIYAPPASDTHAQLR